MAGRRWNGEVVLETEALAAVVAKARACKPRPVVVAAPDGPRPGWGAELVLGVLREASEPLSVMEICRQAHTQFGQRIGKETVRSIVQTSRHARQGNIVKVAGGRYGRYSLGSAPGMVGS